MEKANLPIFPDKILVQIFMLDFVYLPFDSVIMVLLV